MNDILYEDYGEDESSDYCVPTMSKYEIVFSTLDRIAQLKSAVAALEKKLAFIQCGGLDDTSYDAILARVDMFIESFWAVDLWHSGKCLIDLIQTMYPYEGPQLSEELIGKAILEARAAGLILQVEEQDSKQRVISEAEDPEFGLAKYYCLPTFFDPTVNTGIIIS